MIELPSRDTDYIGLLSALWSSSTALTSEAAATIDDLTARLESAERRAEAAERDRAYWREQHDAALRDWRADLQELSAAAPRESAQGAAPDLFRMALVNLLGFFDARTGAVSGRNERALLSDAFARAAEVIGGDRPSRG